MHELTLTPAAAAGLFFSHRHHDVKGPAAIRASCDTEKYFLDPADPLIKSEEVDVEKTPENPRGKATQTGASFKDPRVVRVEKHVFERLKEAHEAVVNDGKVYGYKPGQITPLIALEATTALEGAKEVAAEKTPPRILEKGKKGA